jgi:limonene-1,2-epoxide hydrolase
MTETRAEQVVHAYLDALAGRDFDRARTYLADAGFRYRSPVSTIDGADAYMQDISRVWPILEGIECRKTFVSGNEVCDILTIKTRMSDLRITPLVHWATVESGKIVTVEVFYDAREYAAMFAS